MSTIQDILYAKALADAQYRETDNTGMAVGALTGTAFGAAAAPTQALKPLQQTGQNGRLLATRGGNAARRMAGGLVGAIVGGGLGTGVQQIAAQESPAANILAKIQAQGGLTERDTRELQMILGDIYNSGM